MLSTIPNIQKKFIKTFMFSELKSFFAFKSTLNYVHLSKKLLALILAIDLIIAKPVKKMTNVLYLFLKIL